MGSAHIHTFTLRHGYFSDSVQGHYSASSYQNTSPMSMRCLELWKLPGSDFMFITLHAQLQLSRFTLSHNGWHLQMRRTCNQRGKHCFKRTLISNKHHCLITGVITGPFIIDFFSYGVYRLTNPQTKMADVLAGKSRDS